MAVGLELFVVVAVATFVLRLYSERLGTERGGTVDDTEAEEDSLVDELRRPEGGSGAMVSHSECVMRLCRGGRRRDG